MPGTLIKYQWTDKQREETVAIIQELKRLVYQEEIWSQIDNFKQHEKHSIRGKVGQLERRINKMRKITEEY